MPRLPKHPDEIRDPKRSSGYKYVVFENVPGRRRPYVARVHGARIPGRKGGGVCVWRGEHRATAIEAAWDYIRHVNGNPQASQAPSYPAPTIDMGGTTRHAPKTPGVVVKRTEWRGPTDVYDVLLYDPHDGNRVMRRKVGITAKGDRRYADICATFGWSIKAYRRAVTYKTKAAAKKAESKLIGVVAADSAWKQVGKESFAPMDKTMKVNK